MKDITHTETEPGARGTAPAGTGTDRWPAAPEDERTGTREGSAYEDAGLRENGEPGTRGTGTDPGFPDGKAAGTHGDRDPHDTHGTRETTGTHDTRHHTTGHDTHGTHDKHGTPDVTTTGATLLPHDDRDRLELRLHDALTHFVDRPRDAVEEADHAVEELLARLTEAMTQRRGTLRKSWLNSDGATDTEQLRLALRDYRELAERLLRV
ncbi:hypothetical protein ACI3K4_07270 [Streptomyces sp. CSMPJR101]|uniref:hypothetical protein n=1 Tax=Streptomyces sp. CSMPJR101 TaxID=1279378 RepID=UPI003853E746